MRQFADLPLGKKIAMSPYYRHAIQNSLASGEFFGHIWENVGTPEQLLLLNQRLAKP